MKKSIIMLLVVLFVIGIAAIGIAASKKGQGSDEQGQDNDDQGCKPGCTECCDDGDPCTNDICNRNGECVHPYNTAPCTGDDPCETYQCSGGSCVGQPKCTDDGDPCTDTCIDGECNVPIPDCGCVGAGSSCTYDSDCCNNNCICDGPGRHCAFSDTCLSSGQGPCTCDDECCDGLTCGYADPDDRYPSCHQG